MKIYTRTGDKGKTKLFGGADINKDSLRIDTIGHVDELNSTLGIVISESDNTILNNQILRVQSDLLRVGADLATPITVDKKFRKKVDTINKNDVKILEQEIDIWDKDLPKLTQFILPGGTEAASHTHQARSVCRRAERSAVTLAHEEEINQELLKYLNRLSDWLFTLGRYINYSNGVGDVFSN